MPELPDVEVYLEALEQRIVGHTLQRVVIASPFLLRTATPPISSLEKKELVELRRVGKRICMRYAPDEWLVLHLMIAGRLHWKEKQLRTSKARSKPAQMKMRPGTLAVFEFDNGDLSLTEAGSQRRASIHVVSGEDSLPQFDAGGVEIFETDLETFSKILKSENHTLKRSLADPRLFSGIGNAYSDEILFEARLSPVALTQKLSDEEVERLFTSTRATLSKWVDVLRAELVEDETGALRFPEKVTAFRKEMYVHGRYGETCRRCGNKIQRIRYASNETNYCPNCQTGGKLLADRALSRLLRNDWPRTADELEGLSR